MFYWSENKFIFVMKAKRAKKTTKLQKRQKIFYNKCKSVVEVFNFYLGYVFS